MRKLPRRLIDPQWVFADTRRSLLAVAIVVALPTLLLSELALQASGSRIRAHAYEQASVAAAGIAFEQAERIGLLAENVTALAKGARLAEWLDPSDPRRDDRLRLANAALGPDVPGLVLVDASGTVVASDPPDLGQAIAPELRGPWDRVFPPLVSRLYPGSERLAPYFAVSVPVPDSAHPGTLIAVGDAARSIRWIAGLLTVFEDVHLVDASGTALSSATLRTGAPAVVDVESDPALRPIWSAGPERTETAGGPRLHARGDVAGADWRIVVTQSTLGIADEVATVTTAFRLLEAVLLSLVLAASGLLARRLRRIVQQRERLRDVQELAQIGGWDWDIWGDRITVSEEVLRIYGLGRGEGGNTYKAVLDRVHPDDRESVEREIMRALREHDRLNVRHRVVRPDGTVRIVETRGTPEGAPGRATRVRGTAQDVTEIMRREEERARLTALVESADEALVSSTLDGTITSWNRGAERMFGYAAAEAIGRSVGELRPRERRDRPIRMLDRVRAGQSVADHETDRARKDGSTFIACLAVAPLRDAAGAVVGAAWSFRDVGAAKRAEAELAHRASHDGLTDLPNRFLFEDRLDQAIRSAQRSGRSLGVLTLDPQRFRDINDAFGHATGDLLLIEVAKRLSLEARAIDTVARLGGDKFAILTPDTDETGAVLVASRLRSELQRPFEIDGRELGLDMNVGIALYPQHGEDVRTLLRRSDHASEKAQRTATGSAVYSADGDGSADDRATVVGELRRAIEEDQLVVHYQPLVNIASGLILGVEALVRWAHPTRGLLPPSQFVPLAEQSSLMNALTRHVLTKALHQYRRWHEAGHALPVLVNISPRDLRDPAFVRTIEALHDTYRVSPKWLKLEITEGSVVEDAERAIATLRRVRELGVLIALDDFGTGYSSLSYLGRLPVDAVKIDRSFVAAMRTDPRNEAIVRAIIGLAHTLGFGTVAEGVEDDATLEMLREMGSDMAQGYRIARPMAAAELDEWLTTSSWQPRPAPRESVGHGWGTVPVGAEAAG